MKRQPPDENGFMLLHYVGEGLVEEEETDETPVRFGKCNKFFVELKHDNYIKNKRICGRCYSESRGKNQIAR